MPHLIPPSATAYETDRDALTAQFDAAAELIKDIQSGAIASRTIVEEQREKVDSALDKLQIAINETKDAEARTKAELRDIRDEVNNVRDMLPKVGIKPTPCDTLGSSFPCASDDGEKQGCPITSTP